MGLGVADIVDGIFDVVRGLVGADGLDDLRRDAYRHRAVRDDHSFRHQRPRADDAVPADDAVVEQGRVHPDEASVAHGAAVNERAVAHRHVFAQRHCAAGVAVQDCVVLHVGVLTKGQGAVVAPQHGSVPDAGAFLQHHVAQHRCVGGHKGRTAVLGRFSSKWDHHC